MTRSGSEYLERLQATPRQVRVNGEWVSDVASHPAFAQAARSIARLYDLADDPETRACMTFPSPRDGRPVNVSWMTPHTRDDLVARRHALKRLADVSYGHMGRSPDHVASFFAAFAGSPEFFARGGQQFADNVVRFAAHAADEDLYLTYAIVHPTVDRSRPAHQQPEPNLYASVLKERDNGIVLRGAQMLATGAALSDYVFITVILPLKPGDEDYAISVVVPVDAPGLKLYARRPYALGSPSIFDYPLSTRFDESDALVVLDDVFVPWENVFVYRDLGLTAGQFGETSAHVLGNTQAHIRSWTKLQFLVGLTKRICDRSGQSAKPEVVSALGDLASRVSLVEGLILGAEAAAQPDRFGVMRPADSLLYASQVLQQAMYPEIVDQIRTLMGGGVIQLPGSVEDLEDPESAADLDRYVRWPKTPSDERVKLLKLLWDAVGSEYGGRHLQYEMFYAGEASAIRGREFRAFDWADAERLVDACLASYGADSQRTAVPQVGAAPAG